jgi:hypothetical protein
VTGYEKIKKLAKESGATIPDLLVLARNNDPFFTGTPAHVRDAGWFAELWERYGFGRGTHLRRVHYRLISYEGVTGSDGTRRTKTPTSAGATYATLVSMPAILIW